MRHRLSAAAEHDIEHALTETLLDFGSRQVEVYSGLIDRAIAMVAENPDRPSSKSRDDLGDGVRSFSVAVASGRRSGASHVIYYTVSKKAGREWELLVIRLLHGRMEPRLKLAFNFEDEGEASLDDEHPVRAEGDPGPFAP